MTLISKNFSEVITFSRGTGATRVNSAGLIVGVDFSATSNTIATGSKTFTITADANVNRDWPVGSNVIAVSQAGATGSMTGVVTSYTPSTQALVINVTSVTGSGTSTDWRIGSLDVREDYDPVTLVRKGVLSEVSATNLILRSEEFDNAVWAKQAVTVSPNTTLSPNGSINADSIVEPGGMANPLINYQPMTTTAGTTFTFSIFAKQRGTREYVIVTLGGTAIPNIPGIAVKFSDGSVIGIGTIQSVNSFSAISFPNGYFYISITATTTAGGNIDASVRPSQTGLFADRTFTTDANNGVILWGAQLEISTSRSSYIPTTTAQVTRNADNFPLTAAAVASIRQGEGTLYAEITCDDTGVAQKRALRLSGTNADIRIGKQGTGTLSNFSKMVEGAGLRLMSNAGTALIANNGLDHNLISPVLTRTGVASQVNINGGISFSGTSFIGSQGSLEISFPSDLSTATVASVGSIGINGAHWTGTSFIAATATPGIIVKSTDGISYRVINTPVITQGCTEVTSGLVGGTLRNVIVGNGGFIATSDDNGETWTARTSGTSLSINAITYTGTRFVAQTTGGVRPVIYSDNGITWVTGQSNLGSGDIHAANSLVVTVGLNGDVFVSSDNGVNFTRATNTNTTQLLNGVTYSTTLAIWIAVGNVGTIITATDPAGTWTVRTSNTVQNINEVIEFQSKLYGVCTAGRHVVSSNGVSWTEATAIAGTNNLIGVAASTTTLLITGAGGSMFSSTDGTTFTSRTNNGAPLNGIAFGNNTFVSVGNLVNGSGYIATIAADGTVTRRVSGTVNNLVQIRFLNSQFLVCNNSTTPGILTSADGITFNSRNTNLPLGVTPFDVSFGNSIYITVGATGRAATSSDSTSWSGAATGVTTQQLNGIDFANGIFVAVGNAGVILTTTNGTTWTLRTSGTTQNLNSVMFSTRDNLWYAAGDGGVLLYSPDAITWTAVQNSGTASILGTTLQSNQPLPQFNSGVNKIALSYKSNQVISALNGVASTTDTTATIPSITAGAIGENFNGTIQKIEVLDSALTTSEIIEKTL